MSIGQVVAPLFVIIGLFTRPAALLGEQGGWASGASPSPCWAPGA